MTTHACAWSGCRESVRRGSFACATHWARIPRDLRVVLVAEWNHWRGRGAPPRQYVEAARTIKAWIATHRQVHK